MTFSPDEVKQQCVSASDPFAQLVRLVARADQWQILEQHPAAWQLPSNSLLYWLLMGRDVEANYQGETLQQLLKWADEGCLQPPPQLTNCPGWPQLWRHWIAQGIDNGWLLAKPMAGHWSLWQLLSADAEPLLQALGFVFYDDELANNCWTALFLLSNGYQHRVLDCSTGVLHAPDDQRVRLFEFCCKLPALATALDNEAQVFNVVELRFFQVVAQAQAQACVHGLAIQDVGIQNVAVNSQTHPSVQGSPALSYQQIGTMAVTKPWLLRYMPLNPAMSAYRLALCRYMPWFYRQLWPSRPTLQLLQQWIWHHRLQRKFVKTDFFEAALLAAIADGMPLTGFSQLSLNDEQADDPRLASSLWFAKRHRDSDGKSFVLSDLSQLTQLWWQQCNDGGSYAKRQYRHQHAAKTHAKTHAFNMPVPTVIEQLKVLFLMLQSLRSPQLRQVLQLCPWLVLLLPEARQQRFIAFALELEPMLGSVLLHRLTQKQRVQTLKQAPHLLACVAQTLTTQEFKQLVVYHPHLAVQFPQLATIQQRAHAIANQPELLLSLTAEYRTPELYEALVQLRGVLLSEIPLRQRTFKLCHLAVYQHFAALEFVPAHFDQMLCKNERYWPFYKQSYQWALLHHAKFKTLIHNKLPQFCSLCLGSTNPEIVSTSTL